MLNIFYHIQDENLQSSKLQNKKKQSHWLALLFLIKAQILINTFG